jgi:hypothetical protein
VSTFLRPRFLIRQIKIAMAAIAEADIEKVLASGFISTSLKREELISRLKV